MSPLHAAVPFTRRAFTLVELLVVIGIITLLISILLPTLNSARHSAASTANLSNLRQLGLGLEFYRNDHSGLFPTHSSSDLTSSGVPRERWPDRIYPYLESSEVFLSPLLDERARTSLGNGLLKPFKHTVKGVGGTLDYSDAEYFGGYGYNYQYLGNSRTPGGVRPFIASTSTVKSAAETVAVADTRGSRDGDGTFDYDSGQYVVDPPYQSYRLGSQGSRETSANPVDAGNYGYSGGNGGIGVHVIDHRATPMPRNTNNRVAAVFVDGHGELMDEVEIDDKNGDGVFDNGYWNGLGDHTQQ